MEQEKKKTGDLLKNFAVRNFSFDLVFNFFFYTFRAEQNIFVRAASKQNLLEHPAESLFLKRVTTTRKELELASGHMTE